MWSVKTVVVLCMLAVTSSRASPITDTVTATTSLLMKSTTEESVATSPSTTTTQQPAKPLAKPEMYSLHVTSRIEHRFANTLVSSRLANPANVSQEIYFSVVLPDSAFISKFLMEVGGKVYEAYVKEKEVAKQEYEEAVAAGLGAAHVALSARDSNRFTVSVNIEPLSKVTFNLTYEELLTRRLGAYNHVINLDPGQVVRDLKVDVYIKEARNLTILRVPELRSGNEVDANEHSKANPLAHVTRTSSKEAHIAFTPTPEQQAQLGKIKPVGAGDVDGSGHEEGVKKESDGLGGQFVVQYDVERDPQGGEVLVNDGFFVHFFAPQDLPPLRKHALFVLDVSGSMEGRKIEQLKEAMDAILDDLNPGDYFNIIEFSYSVTVWNLDSTAASAVFSPFNSYHYDAPAPNPGPTPAFPATPEYVAKAKEIVKKMRAGGGTNIYDTLKTVIRVAHDGLENVTTPGDTVDEPRSPIIVFLTDGEPTVGETRLSKIHSIVAELNSNPEASIFSLAFGDDADLGFLKTLSLRNAGFARKIYEASDAALQLRDFYRQIASPLLSNVTFDYVPEQVVKESTTKVNFHTLFAGSELVVAGKLRATPDNASKFDVEVHGLSSTGASTLRLPIPIDVDFIIGVPAPVKEPTSLERLWAYLTIKQLLEKDESSSSVADVTDKDKNNATDVATPTPKKEALMLALKYSFVTSLTSLVVVKPNETANSSKAVDPVDVKDKFGDPWFAAQSTVKRTLIHTMTLAPRPPGGPVDRISSGYVLPFGVAPRPVALQFGVPLSGSYQPQKRPMYATTTSSMHMSGDVGSISGGGGGNYGGSSSFVAMEEAVDEEHPESDEELELDLTGVTVISMEQLQWLNTSRNGSDVILPTRVENVTETLMLYDGSEPFSRFPPSLTCTTAAVVEGQCLHLVNCSLSSFQHDVQVYRKFYFCQIGSFAGVCCPAYLIPFEQWTTAAPAVSTSTTTPIPYSSTTLNTPTSTSS